MQIVIEASALDHLITTIEIRAVVNHPALRIGIEARREGADLALFVGRPADNQPHIEVIADLIAPEYARQRA